MLLLVLLPFWLLDVVVVTVVRVPSGVVKVRVVELEPLLGEVGSDCPFTLTWLDIPPASPAFEPVLVIEIFIFVDECPSFCLV